MLSLRGQAHDPWRIRLGRPGEPDSAELTPWSALVHCTHRSSSAFGPLPISAVLFSDEDVYVVLDHPVVKQAATESVATDSRGGDRGGGGVGVVPAPTSPPPKTRRGIPPKCPAASVTSPTPPPQPRRHHTPPPPPRHHHLACHHHPSITPRPHPTPPQRHPTPRKLTPPAGAGAGALATRCTATRGGGGNGAADGWPRRRWQLGVDAPRARPPRRARSRARGRDVAREGSGRPPARASRQTPAPRPPVASPLAPAAPPRPPSPVTKHTRNGGRISRRVDNKRKGCTARKGRKTKRAAKRA